jgi:hypothetical protein
MGMPRATILAAVVATIACGHSLERASSRVPGSSDVSIVVPAAPQTTANVPKPSDEPWPTTCDAAVDHVLERLDHESREIVRGTRREDLIQFHHGWGTGIRNDLGMWRGNSTLIASCVALRPGTEFHPDSASMIIIEGVWERLHDESQSEHGFVLPKVAAAAEPPSR